MFPFRFQSLLQLAVSQRDMIAASVAETVQARSRLHQQRAQIAAQRLALAADGSPSRLGVMRMDSLLVQHRFDSQLASDDRQLLAAMEQLDTEIERRRAALRLADIEVRKLELLRETDHAAWIARQTKREQAVLDELGSRRFVKR